MSVAGVRVVEFGTYATIRGPRHYRRSNHPIITPLQSGLNSKLLLGALHLSIFSVLQKKKQHRFGTVRRKMTIVAAQCSVESTVPTNQCKICVNRFNILC